MFIRVIPRPTRERFKHLIELAADPATKPDLGICDISNIWLPVIADGKVADSLYTNTPEQLGAMLALLDELGYPRSRLHVFGPESIRTTLAFVRHGILREPVASTLYFGGGDTPIGCPPTIDALHAYVDMLKAVQGIWFASVLGGRRAGPRARGN